MDYRFLGDLSLTGKGERQYKGTKCPGTEAALVEKTPSSEDLADLENVNIYDFLHRLE